MNDPRYGAPRGGAETEAAVKEAKGQMAPALPDRPSAPPLREEYGGPRQSSDGARVDPDPSEPAVATSASARHGHPAVGGRDPDEGGDEGEMPPPLPPDEPSPPPVKDPPAEPTPPYVVRQSAGTRDEVSRVPARRR